MSQNEWRLQLWTRKQKIIDNNKKDEGKKKGTGVKLEMSFYHINGDFTQDVMPNLTLLKLSFGTCLLHHNLCSSVYDVLQCTVRYVTLLYYVVKRHYCLSSAYIWPLMCRRRLSYLLFVCNARHFSGSYCYYVTWVSCTSHRPTYSTVLIWISAAFPYLVHIHIYIIFRLTFDEGNRGPKAN